MTRRKTRPGSIALCLLIISIMLQLLWTGCNGCGAPIQPEAKENPWIAPEAKALGGGTWNSLKQLNLQGNTATEESATEPADIAIVNGRIFALDTLNNRILEVAEVVTAEATDTEAAKTKLEIINILDSSVDEQLLLSKPMAMEAYGSQLYIANSGAGTIVVIDIDGTVERTFVLDHSGIIIKQPRPIGIAINADGDICISDANNYRIQFYNNAGELLDTIGAVTDEDTTKIVNEEEVVVPKGSPERAAVANPYGFNCPSGLAVDSDGNWYVVDVMNSHVKKYSPAYEYITTIGEPGGTLEGGTQGCFTRPKAISVSESGKVYVSDGPLLSVQVFEPNMDFDPDDDIEDNPYNYTYFLGMFDPDDIEKGSMFQAPHGVQVDGNNVYVIDRRVGLFKFDIEGIENVFNISDSEETT